MIAVVGGSGLLGRLVVADLLARDQQVRVLVRDASRAGELLGPRVDVRAVDVRRRDGLDEAFRGVATVVSLVHGFLGGRGAGPMEVDFRGNAHVVAAAGTVGADVVLVSVLGAAPDSPLELFRAKYAAEQALRDSGVPWTIVRAGAFLETWVQLLRQTAGRSGRPLVLGRGEQTIAFVSASDVAAVVVRAATDRTLRGRLLRIGGSPTTMNALAYDVQRADGRGRAPRHLPRTALRIGSVLTPVAPAFARKNSTALLMDTVDLGRGDPDVPALLGLAKPRTASDLFA